MKNFDTKNIDCRATIAMIEKRLGFPRRTLRALLGMTKSEQSGRSMIEMLGVLAIIGVLSVGGIAGYSKAMMKYRVNKTVEQISMIIANTQTFFQSQKKSERYLDLYRNTTLWKKAKLFPDEMWDGDSVKHIFGGSVEIEPGYGSSTFTLEFEGLPTEACIELATLDWGVIGSGIKGVNAGSGDSSDPAACNESLDGEYGYVTACVGKTMPMPLDVASEQCSLCADNCDIFIGAE